MLFILFDSDKGSKLLTNKKNNVMEIYQITKDESSTNLIYKDKLELIQKIIDLKKLFPKSKIDFLIIEL